MRTGKLADLLCASGWNLLYTVKKGEHGSVSVTMASDGTPATVQVAHVKQGNAGSIPREIKHALMSPLLLSRVTATIKDLGVDSLDDIWVNSDVADVISASVNSEGLEREKEVFRT